MRGVSACTRCLLEPGVGKDEADADCGSRLRRLEDDNALYDLEAEADGAALGERLGQLALRGVALSVCACEHAVSMPCEHAVSMR